MLRNRNKLVVAGVGLCLVAAATTVLYLPFHRAAMRVAAQPVRADGAFEDEESMNARRLTVTGSQPQSTESDASPQTHREQKEGGEAGVLIAHVERCAIEAAPSDPYATIACLSALDMSNVGAEALAQWACQTSASFFGVSQAVNVRIARLPPSAVAAFVAEFQAECTRFSETNMLLGAIAYGRSLSEAWYHEFAEHMRTLDLVSAPGNEALIQLAEILIANGDPDVAARVQDIGRGYYGGTSGQQHRAALVTLVNSHSPIERLAYLESVYGSSDAKGVDLGHLFGEFLTSGACWPEGDSRRAFKLLLAVLQDSRFALACATQVTAHGPRSEVPPQDLRLWADIAALAAQLHAHGN